MKGRFLRIPDMPRQKMQKYADVEGKVDSKAERVDPCQGIKRNKERTRKLCNVIGNFLNCAGLIESRLS